MEGRTWKIKENDKTQDEEDKRKEGFQHWLSRQDFIKKRISGSSQNHWETRKLDSRGQEYGTVKVEPNHTTESAHRNLTPTNAPVHWMPRFAELLPMSLLLLPPNLEVILAAVATHHHINHSCVCFLVLFLWRVHLIGWAWVTCPCLTAKEVWESEYNCQLLSPIKIHKMGVP